MRTCDDRAAAVAGAADRLLALARELHPETPPVAHAEQRITEARADGADSELEELDYSGEGDGEAPEM